MGTKNSKNKVKSVSDRPESKKQKHNRHDDELLDDMILFRKIDSRNEPQNRSFIDENENTDEFLTADTDMEPKKKQQKTPHSILVYHSKSYHSKKKYPNDKFIKFKSRSDLSTRHVIFASNNMQHTDTIHEERLVDKPKFNVRFADKVLVMNSSDLDRLYKSATYTNNDPFRLVADDGKYFIDLNDENIAPVTPTVRPKKRSSLKDKNRKIIDSNTSEEFERLRSWNIVKENTFYEDEREYIRT